MQPYRFAGHELKVAPHPPPGRSGGHSRIKHKPPGYDGLSGKVSDGRMESYVAVTVQARSYAEYETLLALFDSDTDGDLEVPHAGDAWVYAEAFVDGRVDWEQQAHEDLVAEPLYQVRVVFCCPKPRPTWKSTGELVF